jgi:hypothetical protein
VQITWPARQTGRNPRRGTMPRASVPRKHKTISRGGANAKNHSAGTFPAPRVFFLWDEFLRWQSWLGFWGREARLEPTQTVEDFSQVTSSCGAVPVTFISLFRLRIPKFWKGQIETYSCACQAKENISIQPVGEETKCLPLIRAFEQISHH